MGRGGQGLHPWLLRTQYFQKTHFDKDDGGDANSGAKPNARLLYCR